MITRDNLNNSEQHVQTLGIIGFGEAGNAFSSSWRQQLPNLKIMTYDIKTDNPDNSISSVKWQEYSNVGVTGCGTLAEAINSSSAVFSFVTADQAHDAAKKAADVMAPDALFFDCNSCAPSSKRASAVVIENAGKRYVDVAVMAPVHSDPLKTPLLICGPHSDEAVQILSTLGLKTDVVPGDIGRASSIKMMRSLMIKGLEALVLESLLAARKAGVEEEVIASLDASFPGWDWASHSAYCMERSTRHGIRRAAEVAEVAKTVNDLGLDNKMSLAIVEWQQTIGELGLPSGEPDLGLRADAILNALNRGDAA
jgi:3-hydroxyisobutyrate dehydrogenase-like beta-hydroxyacid dehydrogenase